MEKQLSAKTFLETARNRVILDVRTPAEFLQGHIPEAKNFPLFSNEERKEVGTLYKQVSPEEAYLRGLELVGLKMRSFVEQAKVLAPQKKLAIHCWRGGKRSQSMAWLLANAGFDVVTLKGGYKAYRNYVLNEFEKNNYQIIVLGGRTGCAKTTILHELQKLGEQVIDLEGMAHHKGSAFGWIGEDVQPSTEHFENTLLFELQKLDQNKRIWVENESRGIGKIFIPNGFWKKMKSASLINIERPLEERVQHLVDTYTQESKEDLLIAFQKIKKRIGGQNLKMAEAALSDNDYSQAAKIALGYYDKTYQYNLEKNNSPQIFNISYHDKNSKEIAEELISFCKQKNI
ncbi:MAG TPA: tRNA 2-selenouridine(34) synthase MnmH [Saprospiraceae bacterium]|nr:tRNA 2-selenouridine(34) synthase MnmH [Saprospiraceae bacterium]